MKEINQISGFKRLIIINDNTTNIIYNTINKTLHLGFYIRVSDKTPSIDFYNDKTIYLGLDIYENTFNYHSFQYKL